MIRFAALLLVAVLFGGMVAFSFGFAPMVFRTLPAEDAGRFIRALFPWYYLFVVVFGGLSAAFLAVWDVRSGWLMLAVALGGTFARQALMPWINSARELRMQGDVEAKSRFARLHGASIALNFAQLIIAGYVLYRFLR